MSDPVDHPPSSPDAAGSAGEDGFVAEHFGVRLRTCAAPAGVSVDDLIRLALRRNPRRAHLLVSQVLGKHVPVDPRVATGVGRLLGELVGRLLDGEDEPLPGELTGAAAAAVTLTDPGALLAALPRPTPDGRPVLVLGYAETATALGHLVADQLGAMGYLPSTRHSPGPVPVSAAFAEGHSHAPDHLLRPSPAELLDTHDIAVLVDDELSTGRTAIATVAALHSRRPRSRYVLATLVDVRGDADRAALDRLAEKLGTRIDVVAVARGRLELPDGLTTTVARWLATTTPDEPEPAAPQLLSAPDHRALLAGVSWVPRPPRSSTDRYGVTPARAAALEDLIVDVAAATWAAVARTALPVDRPRRVLVLGTEEYMYLPLRVAGTWRDRAPEVLVDIRFQSTTRSPVVPLAERHYPVRRMITFRPCEADQTGDRFLYNACWPDGSEPDCVVLFLDEDADCTTVLAAGGVVTVLAARGVPVVVSGLDSAAAAVTGPVPEQAEVDVDVEAEVDPLLGGGPHLPGPESAVGRPE